MKIYRYSRVYSYGDCEEEIFVKANSLEEAKQKICDYKKDLDKVNESNIEELKFNEMDICKTT